MKSFWIFWSGRTISSYGDALFRISMPWFAFQVGGVLMVAVVVTTATTMKPLGSFVMAPWMAGTNSRRVLILTDLLRALVNLAFGILAATGGLSGTPLIEAVMVLVAANAFLMGWFDVGMQMFIPSITEELRTANADLASGKNVVELAGYLTGGLLTSWLMASGFFLNAGSFFLAGAAMLMVGGGAPIREQRKDRKKELFGQWKAARRVISSSVSLNRIFWLSLVLVVCFAPIGTMLAPLAENFLGGGPFLLGMMESSIAVGGLLASFGIRKSRWADNRALWVGSGICAIAEIIAGIFAAPVIVITAMALFGAGQNLFGITESTVIQRTDPELRAPVFAVMAVLVTILYPLASLATAQMVRLTSIGAPFIAGGFGAILLILFLWRREGTML